MVARGVLGGQVQASKLCQSDSTSGPVTGL
jgi:hypothetical protein